MNSFQVAISSRGALQTLLECFSAIKGQWKVFPDDKLAPTDPPHIAETCLQTIRLLDGQLTVYTDGAATAGAKDCCAGVIVTCSDPADPTILHRSHLRGAAKQLPCSSHWNGLPPTTSSTHSQSAPTVSHYSWQLNVGLQ